MKRGCRVRAKTRAANDGFPSRGKSLIIDNEDREDSDGNTRRNFDLGDLTSPPGNRLEALVGDRKGQHSIRINDQFRVCFVWTAEGPADFEIVDYH